jgi:hypothetical protein
VDDRGDPGAVVGGVVVGANVVVGDGAVVGAGWAVVVLLGDDDLPLEPHPATVRLITAIPAPKDTNHRRTLIPPTALLRTFQENRSVASITRLRFF